MLCILAFHVFRVTVFAFPTMLYLVFLHLARLLLCSTKTAWPWVPNGSALMYRARSCLNGSDASEDNIWGRHHKRRGSSFLILLFLSSLPPLSEILSSNRQHGEKAPPALARGRIAIRRIRMVGAVSMYSGVPWFSDR